MLRAKTPSVRQHAANTIASGSAVSTLAISPPSESSEYGKNACTSHTAATTLSFKFNEVACCIALTRHLMDPTFLVFSLAEWKKFTPKEQEVMTTAARAGADTVRSMAPAREAEALAAVKKAGMKVNEIDTGPLQKAAVAAQDELAKDFGAESLLAKIRAQ